MKRLQKINCRERKKIANLNTIIAFLKKQRLVDTDVIEILSKNASANKEFLTRQLCKVTNIIINNLLNIHQN